MTTGVAPIGALSPWRARGLAVAAGAIGAVSLPPFDLWPLLFPAFCAIVVLVASARTVRTAIALGWCAGLGWFGVAMHWIVQPFFVELEIYGWMAPFALILMAGGLALFWGAAAGLAARFTAAGGARVWAFVGLLLLAEAARGRVLSGLPWAQPGHGLIGSELLALAPFGGPLSLTALVLVFAALGAIIFLRTRAPWAVLPLAVGLGLGAMPLTPAPLDVAEEAPVVRIVQINAPQHLKWEPEMIPVFFTRALELTEAPAGPLGAPDLIVWPETSLPEILERSEQARSDIAASSGAATLLVGAQRYAGLEPRNVLAVLDPRGSVTAVYDKHHLVPFGEYIPLRGLAERLGLRGLAQQMSGGYGPGEGPGVIDLGRLGRAFPMICYEAIFPHYIRQVERPEYMINVTNDAWFGSFAMPHQHLALARLRAAEQGLPVIRAANTGISALIDGRGRVIDALAMDVSGTIDAALPPPRPAPLYARTGDWPILILAFLATLTGFLADRRTRPIEAA